MSTQTMQGELGVRPAAATGRPQLLRAELRRLRHRRLILMFVALAVAAVVGGMTIAFFTHSQDVAGARADALRTAQQQRAECVSSSGDMSGDAGTPTPAEPLTGAQAEEMCGPPVTSMEQVGFDPDPRFLPDPDLATTSIAIAAGGALLAALVGATGVGADWSSRAMITLLTWEPRRLRLLGTRYVAIAVMCSVLGVVLQGLGLALGALLVTVRGSWDGVPDNRVGGSLMLGADTFWRDLLSLQLRGVVLMAVTGVLAAAIATLARHTGGLLGVLFGWFAVAESALRGFGYERGWERWLVSRNIGAFLTPGGSHMPTGERLTGPGVEQGGDGGFRMVLVSNLDALLYLGCIMAFFVLLAGLLLRRRDL